MRNEVVVVKFGKKKLRIQKYPDERGRGLRKADDDNGYENAT